MGKSPASWCCATIDTGRFGSQADNDLPLVELIMRTKVAPITSRSTLTLNLLESTNFERFLWIGSTGTKFGWHALVGAILGGIVVSIDKRTRLHRLAANGSAATPFLVW